MQKMQSGASRIAVRCSKSASLCLVIAIVAGCGGHETPRTKLNFWAIGSEVEQIGELFDDFRRQNPDIELRVQQIPCLAAHEKLLTAFAGDCTHYVSHVVKTA